MPDSIAGHIGDRRLARIEAGQSGAAVFRTRGEGTDYFLKMGAGPAAGLVSDEAAARLAGPQGVCAPRVSRRWMGTGPRGC